MRDVCPKCGADLCSKCFACSTQHNDDPVNSCPGQSGNPKSCRHTTETERALRRQVARLQGVMRELVTMIEQAKGADHAK